MTVPNRGSVSPLILLWMIAIISFVLAVDTTGGHRKALYGGKAMILTVVLDLGTNTPVYPQKSIQKTSCLLNNPHG